MLCLLLQKGQSHYSTRVRNNRRPTFWTVTILYPTISFQSLHPSQTDSGCNEITRKDAAVAAVQSLLHASKAIDDYCMITVLDIIKEAVPLCIQALINHSTTNNVIFSLCSSHTSNAIRLLLDSSFSTRAHISLPRQLLEAFVPSPVIRTGCRAVHCGSVSKVLGIASGTKTSELEANTSALKS
ncbi:Coatomer beta subunit [Giardia duodenalis]|uniref:Coatomer beta subunit n=2 Tax=Giardia intestinalis TaxID=5741 RepID=C6LTN1_GIAIB|nr:Hypothetical protein GL50581_2127 [Giardia intestinalis ATCC 50581]ESU40560.1 Coatomer beta subunit [Giardia intestinalis]